MVDEHTLLFGFGVCSDRNCFGIPVQCVGIRSHIGDVVFREKVTELLHGFFIIGHDDIDVGFVLGKTVVQSHRKPAADAAGNRDNENGKVAVRGYDVLCNAEIDVVGQDQRDTCKETSVSLHEDGFGCAERIIEHLCDK